KGVNLAPPAPTAVLARIHALLVRTDREEADPALPRSRRGLPDLLRPDEPRAGGPPLPARSSAFAHPHPRRGGVDAFLDWSGRNKAPRTYEHYRENIQRFATRIPPSLTVAELKPFHVTRAMADFPGWGNNTKHDFIGALKRALNWAADEEMIER